MPITKRGNSYQVRVNHSNAKQGYRRVSTTANTMEQAKALEDIIKGDLVKYGKWPVEQSDEPVELTHSKNHSTEKDGTLRRSVVIALDTHWVGTEYGDIVSKVIYNTVIFFEKRGVHNIDDIASEDVDAFVKHCRGLENSPSTINKKLSMMSVVNDLALNRDPPLAAKKVAFKRVPNKPVEQWWLRPEDHVKATKWLRSQNEHILADFIDLMCYQGFRVQECLRLEERHFQDLAGDDPNVLVPGSKNKGAQVTVPIYKHSMDIINRCIKRSKTDGHRELFPYTWQQMSRQWNNVRDYLDVRHISTSTLKSLRRTFAYYSNERSMPTSTIQKVMRHSSISTTEGYLLLSGSKQVEDSRKYYDGEAPKQDSSIAGAITAYSNTGASPEEVARFAKEIMS